MDLFAGRADDHRGLRPAHPRSHRRLRRAERPLRIHRFERAFVALLLLAATRLEVARLQAMRGRNDEVFAILIPARVALELEEAARRETARTAGAANGFVAGLQALEAHPRVMIAVGQR